MSPTCITTGRNAKGNRTMTNSLLLDSLKDPLQQYEINLRQSLISKFNTFMPAHKQDQTEKRFANSSVREMKNAIGR